MGEVTAAAQAAGSQSLWCSIERLPSLRLLSVETSDLCCSEEEAEGRLNPYLESLCLEHCVLSAIPPGVLGLKNLSYLCVHGNNLRDMSPGTAFLAMPASEELRDGNVDADFESCDEGEGEASGNELHAGQTHGLESVAAARHKSQRVASQAAAKRRQHPSAPGAPEGPAGPAEA